MCCTLAVAQATFASAHAQVSSLSDRSDDPDERRGAVDVGIWFTIFAIDQQTLEIHTVDAAAKVCPGFVKGEKVSSRRTIGNSFHVFGFVVFSGNG